MKKIFLILTFCILSLVSPLAISPLHGQAGVRIECGTIRENEFTNNTEHHIYLLDMKARESFTVSVTPFGANLRSVIHILGPTDLRLARSGITPIDSPTVNSSTLAATGTYKIDVFNWVGATYGGVGGYTLSVGCETEQGVINPGDIPTATEENKSFETDSQISTQQGTISQSVFPFLAEAQLYEISFGSQTKIVKLLELRNDGWAKVEVNGGIGWLNLHQIALIIPLD